MPIGPRPDTATLVAASVFYRGFTSAAVLSVVAHWLAHWVIFRGGWTVHVDAPDRDPIKLRCRGRQEAEARARQIADDVAVRGEAAIDHLR
jgi:hypothetical protein